VDVEDEVVSIFVLAVVLFMVVVVVVFMVVDVKYVFL
jgi:hypothetical protein